jgi:cellulose synthase/poly-beta-1,6-N-acetylglucosamine synthase-like glycosyltransferase
VLLATFGPAFDSFAITIWFWITCLIALVWLKRHIDLTRGRNEPVLRPDEPGVDAADLPTLSMLVAAKDEEQNIGRCTEGLLAQDYPNLQIIVINDRSDDRTGEIIDRFAAADSRLTAVHVEELRPGWFGKNNAMCTGLERAEGNWLCFSDADCAYDSPHLLTAATRFALREQVDFLSVLPRLEAGTLWERIVQPVAGAIMVFWFPPQKVNSPKSPRAYANGAFMLMPRETYDAIGGHEPVKATLNEDMHMARRVKAAGLRLRVIRGGDLYHVRMYTGLKQIWRGWSRIFYGCFGTFPRLLVSFLMLSVFSLSPYVTLLLSGLAETGWAWLAAAGGAAILAQQSVLWRFYGVTGNGPPWALTYPFGAALCLGMTVNAMTRLGGAVKTTWRGTTYRRGARTSSESPGVT